MMHCVMNLGLHLAARNGRLQVVEFLLSRKAEVNAIASETNYGKETVFTPAFLSITFGHYLETARLLEAGAKTEPQSDKEISLLHAAVKNKRENIVKLLLGHGANVNVVDPR